MLLTKRISTNNLRRCLLITFIFTLTACGGGGGSSTGTGTGTGTGSGSGGTGSGSNQNGDTVAATPVNALFKDCGRNHPFYDVTAAETKGYVMASYTRKPVIPDQPAQFKCTDTPYASDGVNVYYRGNVLKSADYLTFEVINDNYAKDKMFVYFQEKRIRLSDMTTFAFMQPDSFYSKDKNSYYYKERLFIPADPATFKVMGRHVAMDSEFIYLRGIKEDRMQTFDKSTFTHIGGGYYGVGSDIYYTPHDETTLTIIGTPFLRVTSGSALTSQYLGGETLIDGTSLYNIGRLRANLVSAPLAVVDLGGRYLSIDNKLYYAGVLLDGASVDNFTSLGNNYTLSNNNLYRYGVLLEQVDPALVTIRDGGYYVGQNTVVTPWGVSTAVDSSTAVYLGGEFYKDGQTVFHRNKSLTNVDVSSYEHIGYTTAAPITKDANQVYVNANPMTQFDAATFNHISAYYNTSQDKLYCGPLLTEVAGADIASFEILPGLYAKDKNKVYYNCSEITQADSPSFVVLNDSYAKDSAGAYYDGVPFTITDPNNFKAINEFYATDNTAAYFQRFQMGSVDINSFEPLFSYYVNPSDRTPVVYAKDQSNYYKGRQSFSKLNYDENTIRIIGHSLFADHDTIRINNTDTALNGFKFLSIYYLINNGEVLFGRGNETYQLLAGADATTFSLMSSFISRDSASVYKFGDIIPNLSPASTKINVGHIYDTDTVIYLSSMLEVTGIDASTLSFFSVRWDTYYKDATNVYWKDAVVVDADVNTFVWVNVSAGYDSTWNYSNGARTTAR